MAGNPKPLTHHVAVLAFPFGSHASALLDVILRLAAASPHVLFSFFTTSKANASLLSKLSTIDNVKTHDVADGLPEGIKPSDNPEEPIGWFMKVAPSEFRRGVKEVEAATELKIRCLVSDAFFWFPGEMAEEMKVVSVPVWTGGPRSLLLHVDTDFIRQRVENIGEDQTLNFLPAFSRFHIHDIPSGIVSGNFESPIATMLHKTGQELPKAPVIVVNSSEKVDPKIDTVLMSRFQKVLNVGPMSVTSSLSSLQDESGCLEWLDKQNSASVVYIGFGRMATPPPHELAAFALALIETGVPFLWSFKGNIEDVLPKGYSRSDLNGKIVPWAPQVQVLGHASTGVFVTHGGWNSVLESIGSGVPMICRPFFGDHQLNTRTIVAIWEIGVELEGGFITKLGMVKALELILKQKEGKEMREKIGMLKELIQRAVGHNGTSTQAFNSLVDIVTN